MSHDINDRIQVAVNWLITGSVKEASVLTGIPERTIRHWQDQPWWDTILEEAKDIKNKELDSVWTQVIHASTEQLKDRIALGDFAVIKGGRDKEDRLIRVPLKASQLALIAAIATDKRNLTRGKRPEHGSKAPEFKLEDLTKELEISGAETS